MSQTNCVVAVTLGTTASSKVVFYDYNYEEVPNDTYKKAYNTLFNWQYEEGETVSHNGSTYVYVSMAVLGTVFLFVVAMDMTKAVSIYGSSL